MDQLRLLEVRVKFHLVRCGFDAGSRGRRVNFEIVMFDGPACRKGARSASRSVCATSYKGFGPTLLQAGLPLQSSVP